MLIKHHSANGPHCMANQFLVFSLFTEAPSSGVEHDFKTVRQLVFILNSTEPLNACCTFSTMLRALFIQCLTCHHILKVMDQMRLDHHISFITSFGVVISTLFIMFNKSNYMCAPPQCFFNRCGVVVPLLFVSVNIPLFKHLMTIIKISKARRTKLILLGCRNGKLPLVRYM